MRPLLKHLSAPSTNVRIWLAAAMIGGFAFVASPTLRASYILLVLVSVAAIRRALFTGSLRATVIDWAVGAYVLVHVSSMAWSSNFGQVDPSSAAFNVVLVLALFSLVRVMTRAEPFNDCTSRIVGRGGLIASAATFVTLLVWLTAGEEPRLSGFGMARNSVTAGVLFGAFLVLTVVNRAWVTENAGRSALFLQSGLFAAALLATGSRGPMLAAGAALLVVPLLEGKIGIKTLVLPVAAVGVLGAAVVASPLMSGFSLVQRGASGRIGIWESVVELILEKPLFGHGVGTEMVLHTHETGLAFQNTHSIYLGTMFDTGIVGLLCFLTVCASAIVTAYTRRQWVGCRIGGVVLAYGLACGVFDFDTFFSGFDVEWLIFWFPVALLGNATRLPEAHGGSSLMSAARSKP